MSPVLPPSPRRVWWVPLLGLGLLAATASPALGQATACDPAALNPSPPGEGRILERYYVATGGVGGRGCWVHRHPNGRDFVVTPHSWGRRPNEDRRAYIDAVLDAVTASRATYERLGNLDVDLAFLLNDVHRGEQEAYWLVSGQCWMEGAAEGTWGSPAAFRQTVAHEIGHCFLMQDGFWTFASFTRDVHRWVDESAAEVLSSEVYPATNYEHRHDYQLAAALQQPYSAHVLLRQYANEHGVPAMLALVRALGAAPTRAQQLSGLRVRGYAPEFLDLLVTHLHAGVSDPGGGTIPNVLAGSLRADVGLDEASDRAALPDVDGLLLTMVDLVVPPEFDARLSAPEGGSHPVEAAIDRGPGRDPERLGGGVTVEGSCDTVTRVPLRLTHLHDTTATGVTVPYALTERSCDDPPDERDSGVIGTWHADRGSILGMFSQVFGAALPIQTVTGDVSLRLTEAGHATLRYENVRIFFEEGRAPFTTLVVRGGGELTWRGGAPGTMVFTGQSFSFQATAGGMTIPMDDSGFPLGETVVRYGWEGAKLVFSDLAGASGTVFFPRVWVRR